MNIIFSDDQLPNTTFHSIFLAGPSPRISSQTDWRHEAVEFLKSINYQGTVIIPSPKDKFYAKHNSPDFGYDNQIEWELAARHFADTILFWVPRDLKNKTYALITNIEFGEDLSSGKLIYGRPDNADNTRYLDKRCELQNIKVHNSLKELLTHAANLYNTLGVFRSGGEVFVPDFIFKTDQFTSWYKNLKRAGNVLHEAKFLHHVSFKIATGVFCYTLWVKVWITSEHRFKQNEFVFSRKDISCVVPYYRDENNETFVVLIKEFRSPVSNDVGFVFELPGGSSTDPGVDPKVNAQHELSEEAGLHVEDATRFEFVGTRQLVATLCSHTASVYKIQLTREEFLSLQVSSLSHKVFGLESDSERTSIEIMNVKSLSNSYLDFSMIGMIYQALVG